MRPAVALAAVKLIRFLPAETERWQLPKVLQTVANLLASRMQGVRDDARAVLVKLVRALGPAYMPFVCDTLAFALPAKGFTAHVLGYTLHACLRELVDMGTAPGTMGGGAPRVWASVVGLRRVAASVWRCRHGRLASHGPPPSLALDPRPSQASSTTAWRRCCR